MHTDELLLGAFANVHDAVHRAVDGASGATLAYRPDDGSNSVAWLVWHLARIQDDHVADVAGTEQAWTADGWGGRFDLPFDATETGYGAKPEDVAALSGATADLLTGYYDAVHQRTLDYVRGLSDEDLDRVVDIRWDPPVTLGVRLTSVITDDLEHAGQAAYVRGVAERR